MDECEYCGGDGINLDCDSCFNKAEEAHEDMMMEMCETRGHGYEE